MKYLLNQDSTSDADYNASLWAKVARLIETPSSKTFLIAFASDPRRGADYHFDAALFVSSEIGKRVIFKQLIILTGSQADPRHLVRQFEELECTPMTDSPTLAI